MSDQADRETIGDDLGVWSVDAEDQLQPEDTLDGEGDVLDRGYSAGDHYRGAAAYGVTADEQSREETIDQRVRQEERDPCAGYEDGSQVSRDREHRPDDEARRVAQEWRAASWDSPEESAMHYVDGEDEELSEVEWDPSDEPAPDEDE